MVHQCKKKPRADLNILLVDHFLFHFCEMTVETEDKCLSFQIDIYLAVLFPQKEPN